MKFDGGKKSVIDGPFAGTKELVAGFWIWKVNSRQEAIDWLKRAPSKNAKWKSAKSSKWKTSAKP